MGEPIDLVADIGATNARFAMLDSDGAIAKARVYATEDYGQITEAIDHYLADVALGRCLRRAVLAVACPVTGDEIALTNHTWTFSKSELATQLELEQLHIINDCAAIAHAIPRLAASGFRQVGGGEKVAGGPIGLIAPGSGLGISAIIMARGEPVAIESEGGHVTMAATSRREAAVLELMRSHFDHVSAERVLSGPGLANLYRALCELDGVSVRALSPAQIADQRIEQSNPQAAEAVALFCTMLGTAARNLALTLGSRGGIYVGGGIVPRLGPRFARSGFRRAFEGDGRLRTYVANIPTYIITEPLPALIGAALVLSRLHPVK